MLYWVHTAKDITLQNHLMLGVCWKTKSHMLVPPRSRRINKVRLAPILWTAPSTCLRETLIYFYCRRRPSRPHIKHLNSCPLCSHMPLFGEAEPESCVNIKVHTLLFGGVGVVFFVVGALWSETDKTLVKTIGGKKRLDMQWPQSVQHDPLSSTTQLHVALHPEKSHTKYYT